MGLFEILEINESRSAAILREATAEDFQSLALENGMRTLFADGIRNAVEGLTTVDEVLRVTYTAL
jgi:type II secretory ATPase GspE/PulE/Tfp pilus assembly ATPase PilB-like protein